MLSFAVNMSHRERTVFVSSLAIAAAFAASACSRPTSTDCHPACAEDYECISGSCEPICDPPCPEGWVRHHPTATGFYGDPDASTDPGWEPGPQCGGLDSDFDWIRDYIEGEGDQDGDTIPNVGDDDSDGDTILDRHEAGDLDCDTVPLDSDGDTIPDFMDLDSDEDGVPDSAEAGDEDPETRPVDTDGWSHQDYRDTDSDNDGLGDAQEQEIGTNRLSEDTDGDGWGDMDEIASVAGDPLDPGAAPAAGERIFWLWYRGRSQYETLTVDLDYRQTDVFFLVDDTHSSREAVEALTTALPATVVPEMTMLVPGLHTGSGQFSGWQMPGTILPAGCLMPFMGIARVKDGSVPDLAADVSSIPHCPEPLLGAAVVESIFDVAGDSPGSLWPPSDTCPDGVGGACFSASSRRVIMLLVSGEIPASTPAGHGAFRTLSDASDLLEESGVHLVGLVAADDPSDPAYFPILGLAEGSGAVDFTGRPIVHLLGSDGSMTATGVMDAVRDVALRMPTDASIVERDGADWPATGEEVDATNLISTVYPLDWSPPPGFSPSEACDGIDYGKFLGCVPGTTIAFKIYYRNYSVEQETMGRVFGAAIDLEGTDGYVFARIPLSFVVPALDGDSE